MPAKVPATLCRFVFTLTVPRKVVRWPKVKMSYGRLRARSHNYVWPFMPEVLRDMCCILRQI